MTTKRKDEPHEWYIDLSLLPLPVSHRGASLLDVQAIERLPQPVLEALGRVIGDALGGSAVTRSPRRR